MVSRSLRRNLAGYTFIAPFFLFLVVFSLIPMVRVLTLSFQTEGIIRPATWVGIDNYAKIFRTPEYFSYFLNNLVYVLIELPFGQLMAFSLALLLRRKAKASSFFETLVFLPLLLSMVAAGVLMYYMFSQSGPVNSLARLLGLAPVNWFGKPGPAKVFIAILEIWKGDTFFVFIYLAALRAIPAEYEEAARLDGASAWQMLTRVTIPLLRGTILFCVTMLTIWAFQIFDSIFVTTAGGPLGGTTSLVFEIYRSTFKHNDAGLGATLSVLFLMVILTISLLQQKLMAGHNDA